LMDADICRKSNMYTYFHSSVLTRILNAYISNSRLRYSVLVNMLIHTCEYWTFALHHFELSRIISLT
jgi:hypothetical protein